jgi:hypothetical protein
MDKINIPIDEILKIINFEEHIPKTKDELIKTICALDSNYYHKIDGLLYFNIYTLKNLINTILEIKYPNKKCTPYKDIVFTEDMIYY